MLNKTIAVWTALIILVITVLHFAPKAAAETSQECTAYAVSEGLSGNVILAQEAAKRQDVAGLSRLPALLLICEAIDSGTVALGDTVTVSDKAAAIPGPSAFLSSKETIRVEEMLNAAVIILAGDAILALCEMINPSQETLCAMLNARMKELNVDTEYVSVLDNQPLSANELIIIGSALLQSNTFKQYGARYYYELLHENGLITTLASSNKLLKQYAGTNGIATGSSESAGYCGLFSVSDGTVPVICCIIGTKTASSRSKLAMELLDVAYGGYDVKKVLKKGDVVKEAVPVLKGRETFVNLVAAEDVVLIVPKGVSFEKKLDVPDELAAPLATGQKAGTLKYIADGTELASVDVLFAVDVPVAEWKDYASAIVLSWLHV